MNKTTEHRRLTINLDGLTRPLACAAIAIGCAASGSAWPLLFLFWVIE